MKNQSLSKKLAFRIATPVIAAVLIIAVLIAVLAHYAFTRFDEERHRIRLTRLSQRTHLFCESAYKELERTVGARNERKVRIAQARVVAGLEDFFRSTGLEGLILDGRTMVPLTPGLPEALRDKLMQQVPVEGRIDRIAFRGASYYVTMKIFSPWGWKIVLAINPWDTAQLYSSMRTYFIAGFLLILVLLAAIFVALNAVILRPINEIVRTVRNGGLPQYTGIAEFEYLSRHLRESIQKRSTLLANIERTNFIYIHDVNGQFTYLSPSVTAMLGYTEEDFATHFTTYLTTHPANRLAVERAELNIKGIQQPTTEVEVFHKAGGTRWLEVTAVPVFDDQGRVTAVEGIAHDITDRKKTEDDLRANRELLSSLMASLPGMAYRCRNDQSCTMEFVSEGCLELTGYGVDDLTGSPALSFGSLIHPEDRGIVWRLICEAIAKGERYRLTYRIFCADDTIKWVWEQGQALHAPAGSMIRVGFITDITAIRRLEDELLKTQKLESLGVLAGGIAHDFNNLLQAILGNISLARLSANAPDKVRERLVEAELATRRAGDLSNRLLTFSSGGRPLKKILSVAVPLREVLQTQYSDPLIVIVVTIAADLRSSEIDEAQIRQVFQNVLQNAREALSGGGKVRVVAENAVVRDADGLPLRSGQYVKVTITDSGMGIPKEHRVRLFDPYFTTKDMGPDKGRGLGLTVCHSIVTKHNGIITIDSPEGGGTVVSIYLPAVGEGKAGV